MECAVPAKSSIWTFPPARGFVRAMTEHTADLVAGIAARVGMIMEDVVDTALTLGVMDDTQRGAALQVLEHAAMRIQRLTQAAVVLYRE